MSATLLVVAALVVPCDAGFPSLSDEHAVVAAANMATAPAHRHHVGIIAIRLSKSQGARYAMFAKW
ncbi:hypothetical protein OG563_45610 [Nocardia vinacea]|uniref:Uncharacterized protein n=1 Tax=Nocardia vinacea TaxID=96468 RepID=A0ABZ1YT28_9NOCA|nr:hypothetical protein [Nocardia vinacea]